MNFFFTEKTLLMITALFAASFLIATKQVESERCCSKKGKTSLFDSIKVAFFAAVTAIESVKW